MNAKRKELLIYYNSNDPFDREALGYTLALDTVKLKSIDLQKELPTPRQVKELADKMEVQPIEIYEGTDKSLSEEDVLTLLSKDPSAWISPIIVEDHRAFVVKSPLNLIKKDLDIT